MQMMKETMLTRIEGASIAAAIEHDLKLLHVTPLTPEERAREESIRASSDTMRLLIGANDAIISLQHAILNAQRGLWALDDLNVLDEQSLPGALFDGKTLNRLSSSDTTATSPCTSRPARSRRLQYARCSTGPRSATPTSTRSESSRGFRRL